MSVFDDPKAWAKAQVQQLREDPKAWARERGQEMRALVDVAPFSDEALARELTDLRTRMAKAQQLAPEARQQLHDDLLNLQQRLTPSGAMVSGAKIGLAAAVLPVIGMISGPVIGGAYGALRAHNLGEVRAELQTMLRQLARG